jgi:hypothetical protein
MRNILLTTTALASLFAAGTAFAEGVGSTEYSAGVSLLLPEQTGFMYTAQVDAQGLGAGTSAISASSSSFTLTGIANSSTDTVENASAGSGIYSDFNFDRTVETNAASAGIGRVVATGDAIGKIGALGAADSSSSQKSVDADGVTASDASSESQASLIGGARTSLVAGVVGTLGSFVGDTGTSVTDDQSGLAMAGSVTGYDASGLSIDAVDDTNDSLDDLANLDAGYGLIGVSGQWDLYSGLDLAVANAGGGTVSLGADTGGFFTGGVATTGSASHSFAAIQ